MPSLLISIFLLQLAIHAINTIGVKTINELLWQFASFLPLKSSKKANEVTRLRAEVVKIKREMNAVSAQDDFAKWARIRRTHDKVLAEHDKKAAELKSLRSSFDTKASAVRWTFTVGLRFMIQMWYAKVPVYHLPKDWLPWFVEWGLAFPRCPTGGVSVNTWNAVCAVWIQLVAEARRNVVKSFIEWDTIEIPPAPQEERKRSVAVPASVPATANSGRKRT